MNGEYWIEFFEGFPRQKLPAKVTRRRLLSAMLSELDGATSESDGKQAFRLTDLGDLPDAALAPLIPWLALDAGLVEREGCLWAWPDSSAQALQLFPLEGALRLAYEQFDGQRTLGEISTELALALGWEAGRSFAIVRGLFLSLVFAQVCFPKNPLGQ